jgi:hypothetical protein
MPRVKVNTDKAAELGKGISIALQETVLKFLGGKEVDGETIFACYLAMMTLLDFLDMKEEPDEFDELGEVSTLVFEQLSRWAPMPKAPAQLTVVK